MKTNTAETTRKLLRDLSFVDVPLSSLYDMKSQAELNKLGSIQK